MICSQCRFDNPPVMKFCVECGTSLQVRCRECDSLMLPSYKFCGECGRSMDGEPVPSGSRPQPAPLPAPLPERSAPTPSEEPGTLAEGERKQVSVLYCSLPDDVGEQLSPDHLHDLLTKFFQAAQREIQQYGGTVNRRLSHGFMALFGAPVAYEDHPRRALLAAFSLLRALDEEGLEGPTPSLGIDTGAVVVGGAGAMAVGEATQNAAELQRAAAPGEVLVSGSSARLLRRLAKLSPRDAVASSGKSIETWQAEPGREPGTVSPFSSKTTGPLVGRDREISTLEQLREQAREGRGQVVALTGEAGSGKSRLLHELYKRTYFDEQTVSYLRGQCASYGAGIPYFPFVGMVRNASGIVGDDSQEEIVAKLHRSLGAVGTDLVDDTLPFLLRLLGVHEGTEALDELEPQAIQARTFAAMRRMLLDAARHALVVVEIEDLQWIDTTSAEFLDTLIDSMAAGRLLVILTYRSGYQPKWLDKSYATQLRMTPLSEEDGKLLVSTLLERADLDPDLATNVLEKAEGNPFFLEEMARALIEGSGQADSVPDTVQGILMARIDRLPEEHKKLLRTVSVLGRELPVELVRAIWDGSGDDLESLLEALQRWELLYKAPSEDQVIYFFRQALTQEVTYQSLLASRREKLHRRAAQALEEIYAGRLEEAYDRLIYHYPRAAEPQKTVHYLGLFAHQAAEAYAHAEAAQALREALVQAELFPEEERDRRVIELVLRLAESLLPLAGFPETLELCRTHLERLESLDDPELAGPYYFWLAHTYTYLGLQEETRDYAAKSIEAARSCEDETTEGKARYVLGRDGFWSGQFQSGIENSLKAVVLLERNDEPWWQGQAYWVAGFNHYVLGQFEEAIDALERALALGEALDDYRLDTSWSLGYFYASLGEADMGIEQCRRGLDRSQDPLNSGVSTGFLGHAMLQKGDDLDGAIDALRRATELMGGAGMQQLEGWFSAFLGGALLAKGELDEAREAAQRGLDAATEARFWYGVGLAQSTLGRIALAREDADAASEALHAARERFEELEVPLEIARLDLDLGLLGRAGGDSAAADEAFGRAREGFERLGVPYWIDRAESVIADA